MASEILVEFDAAAQSLSALNAVAYRLLGTVTCQINKSDSHYICRLTPTRQIDTNVLRSRFLELVTDENVRADLRARTEPVRNLILSLAFGAIATQQNDSP